MAEQTITPNALININFAMQAFKEKQYRDMIGIIQDYAVNTRQNTIIVFCSTKVFNSIFSLIDYAQSNKIQYEVDDSLIGGNDFQYSEMKIYINDKFIINYTRVLEV